MKRQIKAFILAGAIAITPVCGSLTPAMSTAALTITATPTSVTIPKGVIAVGETMRIEFKWSTGAVPDTIRFSSHDDDIASVDQDGVITGVDTGITEIYVDIDSIGKRIHPLFIEIRDSIKNLNMGDGHFEFFHTLIVYMFIGKN